ncbi:hypothetical protein UFOVP787_25 [uncultured Caudovirales phage]|uniref:Uncharacterized protein n=1 Tax=uncultured Caudovirales phage TaxID=2100421 RepID=A0A6J5NYY3_9CAUD|nr:hypothetical protein UFOVP787_25 [uncultured Caudovirales phage]
MPLIANKIIIRGQEQKTPDQKKEEQKVVTNEKYHVIKDGELVHKYNKKSDYLKDMTDFK